MRFRIANILGIVLILVAKFLLASELKYIEIDRTEYPNASFDKMVPEIDKNGKVTTFVLKTLNEKSPLKNIGVEVGDKITSINGKVPTSIEIASYLLITKGSSKQTIKITIDHQKNRENKL